MPMRSTSLCMGLLCMTLTLVAGAADAKKPTKIRQYTGTMNVVGQAEMLVQADVVDVRFSLRREAKTAHSAYQAITAAKQRIFRALKRKGVKRFSIKHNRLSIYPSSKQVSIHQTMTITLRDLSSLPRVIDSLTQTKSGSLGIVFRCQRVARYKRRLRTLAAKAARQKARTLAKATGVKLGYITSISEHNYNYHRDWGSHSRNSNVQVRAGGASGGGTFQLRMRVSLRYSFTSQAHP